MLVDPRHMQGARVNFGHKLRPQLAIAFDMGLSPRLGAASSVRVLDENLVKMVLDMSVEWPEAAGKLEGLALLLGGLVRFSTF